jgi:hypothetical protein
MNGFKDDRGREGGRVASSDDLSARGPTVHMPHPGPTEYLGAASGSGKADAGHGAGGSPLDDAIARMYLRRNLSRRQLADVERHLETVARGRYVFGSYSDWTTLELTDEADLLSLRKTFPGLIDGWRELP